MIISPATTPQLWVEQWWRMFSVRMEIVRLDVSCSYVAHGTPCLAAGDAREAEDLLDRYMEECSETGCRSAHESLNEVRYLMALKYELRG